MHTHTLSEQQTIAHWENASCFSFFFSFSFSFCMLLASVMGGLAIQIKSHLFCLAASCVNQLMVASHTKRIAHGRRQRGPAEVWFWGLAPKTQLAFVFCKPILVEDLVTKSVLSLVLNSLSQCSLIYPYLHWPTRTKARREVFWRRKKIVGRQGPQVAKYSPNIGHNLCVQHVPRYFPSKENPMSCSTLQGF